MGYWFYKLAAGVFLIAHSIAGNLGYVGHMPQLPLLVPLILIIGAGSINLYHYYLIRSRNNDISNPERLITGKGLFKWVRHPMYFCDLWLYTGLALFPMSYISMFVLVTAFVSIFLLSQYEDQQMENTFGSEFVQWKAKTALLIPGFQTDNST